MSQISLEARVERVEKTLMDLQHQISARGSAQGVLALAGTMSDYPEFETVMEHAKYIRRTGELPPPDWKPGDPIPEPHE